MADLIGAMERLWFHEIILVPETTSLLLVTKNLNKQHLAYNCMDSPPCRYQSSSSSSSSSSSGLSRRDDYDDEISSTVLSTPTRSLLYKDDSDIERVDEECEEEGATNERPTRLNLTARRAWSHSSLPSNQAHKLPKKHVRNPKRAVRLEKSMSCRSFQELELEELKGFMDLGFKFKKEHLSPRLLRVVPGLQRLGLSPTKDKDKELAVAPEAETLFKEEEEEEAGDGEDERVGVMRPYLSEAWLIRRPNSPLLNLKVPRVTAASDMKKHLRCWARTVAYVIQQESS